MVTGDNGAGAGCLQIFGRRKHETHSRRCPGVALAHVREWAIMLYGTARITAIDTALILTMAQTNVPINDSDAAVCYWIS
jgi:hypothetical protein